jgi:pimeloyl-ACP methyl ester carboxylesterase
MELDALRINYEVQGQGPLVFLLHGWGANLALFAEISASLSQAYTVVSMDFPGCGLSSEPTQAWGMDEYVSLTARFIASFESPDVILLGHSHGGRVAIRLATDPGLPFRVTKMILVGSAGILATRSLAYHLRVKIYKAGKKILTLPKVGAAFPDALEALQQRLGSADYGAASPVMRASLVKVVNTDLEPLLAQIRAETLLIWGELDTDTPLSHGQLMEKAIPGSGLVVIPGGGHYCFLDQAYTFRKVIESFLEIG